MNLCFLCPLGADLIKELQCSNLRNLLPLWPPPTSSPLGNYIFALTVCGGGVKKGKKKVQTAQELHAHCIVNRKYIAHLSAISSLKKQKSISEMVRIKQRWEVSHMCNSQESV